MNRGRTNRGTLHGRGRRDIVVSSSSPLNTGRTPSVTTRKITPSANLLVGSTSRTQYTERIPSGGLVIYQIESTIVDIQKGNKESPDLQRRISITII